MTRKKKIIISGLSLLIMGFTVLNILAYNHASAMLTFATSGSKTSAPEKLSFFSKAKTLATGINLPRPGKNISDEHFTKQCQTLDINSVGEVILKTSYISKGRNTPLVLLFHGYGADRSTLVKEANEFLKMNLSVLLVDFRGSGGSSKSYTTIGYLEADDVFNSYQFAKTMLKHKRHILFGKSMGAAAILCAIDRHKFQPDAIILESVFDRMLNTVKNRFDLMGVPSFPSAQLLVFWGGYQFDFNAFSHNPEVYAKSVKCPTLFLHGENDPRAKLKEGESVYQSIMSKKEFVIFKGKEHVDFIDANQTLWVESVSQFLLKHY